jgi:hypothetical protein
MVNSHRSTPWPVGIRLFNRPEYTERFLQSLMNQSVSLDPTRTICFIDGYPKSSDYFQKVPDRTQEVADMVATYLPRARTIRAERNVGLAKALFTLQQEVFHLDNSQWGIFLEDDLVLDESYLEVLDHLIELSPVSDKIVKVAACQFHLGYQSQPPASVRKNFFIGQGTQAFAEKNSYFQERKAVTETYLHALEGDSYLHKNRELVFAALASQGIFNVMGNNDGALDQMIGLFNKLHIVAGKQLLKDIGIQGETSFRYPDIVVPHATEAQPLATTAQDLAETLPNLESEFAALQHQYFADMWQVYRRANSVQHTLRFVANKLIQRLLATIRR